MWGAEMLGHVQYIATPASRSRMARAGEPTRLPARSQPGSRFACEQLAQGPTSDQPAVLVRRYKEWFPVCQTLNELVLAHVDETCLSAGPPSKTICKVGHLSLPDRVVRLGGVGAHQQNIQVGG